MTKAQLSVEEIVASLKKSALPTVVCEGADDLIIYRRLEESLSHIGVDVLPAGGRKNVLQIFDRRAELPKSVKIAFIADRDTWVNNAIPANYVAPALCLTSGYSIENDAIADGELEKLLVGSEYSSYQAELKEFLDWYALALDRHLKNQTDPISHHPDRVLNTFDKLTLMTLRPGEKYPSALRESLTKQYVSHVRGKSLLSLLIRNTNTRPGQPKHTDKALLEIVAVRPGSLLIKLTKEVEAALRTP